MLVAWLCGSNSYTLLGLIGLVDSMIAVSLLVSVLKQAPFIPHAYDSCDGAINWKNGTDGRNYFLVANSTAFASYGGPSKLCHAMVEFWAMAVSIMWVPASSPRCKPAWPTQLMMTRGAQSPVRSGRAFQHCPWVWNASEGQ